MSGKQKLKRFKDNSRLGNVSEYTDPKASEFLKGNWSEKVFQNSNPIVLELACGKGEYSVALAKKFPGKNFIGVDIKGARLWVGATRALEAGLDNVHFLRAYVDHLDTFFEAGEVSEIWITFPDPYIEKARKRLTSPKFLKLYRKVAAGDCLIHLKTDSELLWNFTTDAIEIQGLEIMDICDDIYQQRPDAPLLTIQTFYEQKHLSAGKKIRYISFRLNP